MELCSDAEKRKGERNVLLNPKFYICCSPTDRKPLKRGKAQDLFLYVQLRFFSFLFFSWVFSETKQKSIEEKNKKESEIPKDPSPCLAAGHESSVSGVWHPWKTQNKQESNPSQTSLSFLIYLKPVQWRKKMKKQNAATGSSPDERARKRERDGDLRNTERERKSGAFG